MKAVLGLTGLGLMLAGVVYFTEVAVEDRDPEDYHINTIEVDGMECITIHQYSQVGITCDWR